MSRIYSLDMLKGIAAILVVALHIPLEGRIGQVFGLIGRSSVACFLMVSGYMVSKKCMCNAKEENIVYIKKVMRRISKITLTAMIIYFADCIVFTYHFHVIEFLRTITPNSLWRLLIFNEPSWGGTGHLWYLFAYIYVLIIFLFVSKDNGKIYRFMYQWAILGTVAYYLLGKYSVLLIGAEPDYIYVRNFVLMGIPCFFIGYYIGTNEENMLKRYNYGMFVLVSVILLCIEYELLTHLGINSINNNYISNLLLSVSAVLFALQHKDLDKNFLSVIGEKYSLPIYLYHMLINSWVIRLSEKFELIDKIYYSLRFIMIVPVCLFLIWSIRFLKRKAIRYKDGFKLVYF